MYFCFQDRRSNEALDFYGVKRMYIDVKFDNPRSPLFFYVLNMRNGEEHWISIDNYDLAYVAEKF